MWFNLSMCSSVDVVCFGRLFLLGVRFFSSVVVGFDCVLICMFIVMVVRMVLLMEIRFINGLGVLN